MGPAVAADRLGPQDMQLAGRVLHFVDAPPTGAVTLAIVYADDVPGSRDEARNIASFLSGGLQSGDLILRPALVEQRSLDTLGGYAAIITAAGVSVAAVRDAMRRHHAPCLTAHLSQVQDGGCLVGIRSLPAVSIELNSTASAAVGIRFATAFRMMVQEL